jgi:hypothetical protein
MTRRPFAQQPATTSSTPIPASEPGRRFPVQVRSTFVRLPRAGTVA